MPDLIMNTATPNSAKTAQSKANVLDRIYPECAAGGFSRADPRMMFYIRVNALIEPHMTVVDLGAGRGLWADIATGYRRSLCVLRGKCRHVIGVDPDPAVMENKTVDEALIASPDGSLPLTDNSAEMIVAYAVLEHVSNPEVFAREVRRVLRPGGWLCAWTPNKWGYIGLGARLVPNALHAGLLPIISPGDQRWENDVFPTYYRLNTISQIRRFFGHDYFDNFSFLMNGLPTYNFNSHILARLLLLYGRLVPPALSQHLHVFIRRR